MRRWRIKKGDQVVVRTGREKGKSGEVIEVLRDKDRVVVKSVNVVKRHTRPTPENAGGIVEKEASLHVSNVGLMDPETQKPTRVGAKFLEDGKKVRVAKRSGKEI